MKKLFSLFSMLLIAIYSSAQVPLGIPYQAAARNSNGQPLPNRQILLRFSILDSTDTGIEVYKEVHTTTTNALGLFALNVGRGTVVTGAFSTINWGQNFKFLKVELDTTAIGSNYVDLGTQQMMSVPFALYSNNGMQAGTMPGQMNYWDGTTWVPIAPGSNNQTLTLCNGVPTWGPCTLVVANLPSVTICNQVWTSKNLDVSTYKNGDIIPQVTNSAVWATLTTGAWCWYNNDSTLYASIYGKLYNWYAVTDIRGLAPIGWHIPTDSEWNELIKCADPAADTLCLNCNQSNIAGGMLKETGTTHWMSPNVAASNITNFTGLPGGYRGSNGNFGVVGYEGDWWSATETNANNAINRILSYNNSYEARFDVAKRSGFSIRCIKD